MANILTKRKFKKYNKLNKKTKKNKWNRKTKKQVGGAGKMLSSNMPSAKSERYTPIKYRKSSTPGSVEFRTNTESSKRGTVAENNNTSNITKIKTDLSKLFSNQPNNNFTTEIDRNNVNQYLQKDPRAPIKSITPKDINNFFLLLFPGNIYIDDLDNFRDKMKKKHRKLFDEKKLDFIDETRQSARKKFSLIESLFLQELPPTIYSNNMPQLVNPTPLPFVDKYIEYALQKGFNLQNAYTAKMQHELAEQASRGARRIPVPMNTLKDFYSALRDSYYIFNKIGSKIIPKIPVILIDVENLIVSAHKDRYIDMRTAYQNLKKIITTISASQNFIFILINHMNSWEDRDFFTEINSNMYIINANCDNDIPCEKDDFLLVLLMQYFQQKNICSVITHDNYSWYKNIQGSFYNFFRTTIEPDQRTVSENIPYIESQRVKKFAYTLGGIL